MNRIWGEKKGVTPLVYLPDSSPIADIFRVAERRIFGAGEDEATQTLRRFIPYLKPAIGASPYRKPNGELSTLVGPFDVELEWRFVPNEFKDTIYVEELWSQDAHDRAERQSARTKAHRLTFVPEDVDHLIVPDEKTQTAVQREFPAYAAKVYLWREIRVYLEEEITFESSKADAANAKSD